MKLIIQAVDDLPVGIELISLLSEEALNEALLADEKKAAASLEDGECVPSTSVDGSQESKGSQVPSAVTADEKAAG